MGVLMVRGVALQHVMVVLVPIWRVKTETASQVRGRIEPVLDWATARGFREGPNPARWRGHLDKLLPAPGKVTRVEHHDALSVDQAPGFIAHPRAAPGIGACALYSPS